MNCRLIACVFLTLSLTLAASAQGKPGGGGAGGGTGGAGRGAPNPTRTPGSMQPSMNAPDSTIGQRAFISGKVVLDDGTQLTESASILTICRGRKQTMTHTDSHGSFSFELSDRMANNFADYSGADIDSPMGPPTNRSNGRRDWRECELLAELPGFTSQSIDLASRLSTFETADIGRLVLHRMGKVEGLTISATSAAAPKNAQKAFEKGRDKAAKEKWDEAEKLLSNAVEIYPKYAVAWFELGRAQLNNQKPVEARHSFEQSIAADSKYANPYRGLAELDTREKQWPALVTVTDQLLALNPISFPDAWFRNALGNYYLQNFAAAEKSARQGMKLDDQHQLPKMEYLLGILLVQKREYAEATTHIQNYLKTVKQPAEIADAQKQLAEISRLSASASDPAPAEKK